jgi:nucleoside-diphosphate-sugar epimerase
MAVLITGGYGLLGSWVARNLAEEGRDVLLLDVVRRDLSYLDPVSARIEFIRASVMNVPRLTEVFSRYQGKIEGIIHTVAVMATPAYWNEPHAGTNVNVMGTVNLLEMARIFGVEKFLYVSSGAVYGVFEGRAHEENNPLHPGDLYGAAKASAELIGGQYENHYGIDFRCVRPYFFFGPGKLPSELPHLFTMLLGPLESLPDLSLEKGAEQRLGFTCVRDAARGTALLYGAGRLAHKTFNIASEVPVSFRQMADLAQKYGRHPTGVSLGPGRLFPRGETLDISRAREELGFEPSFTVEEGMEEYAAWIEEYLDRRRPYAR